LNTLESFASQVGDAEFNEDSLLSLTNNLKLLFNSEEATLFALDEARRELFTKNFHREGFPEIRLNISVKNIAGFVAATGKPINIKNVKDSQELSQYHPKLTYDSSWDKKLNKDTTSMIVVPLPFNKKLVGVMEIINKEGGFSQEDFFKAKAIAPIMGMAIAKLKEKEDGASNGTVQERQLHVLSQMIHSSENFDSLLKRLKEPLLKYFGAEAVTIYGVDENRKEIYSKVTYGNKLGKIRVPISSNSVAGYVAMIKKTLNIQDLKDIGKVRALHPKLVFDDSWEKIAGISTRSMLTMPLLHGENLMGVLQLINKKNMTSFSIQDEKNGFLIGQALGLALYNQKKNSPPEVKKGDEVKPDSISSLASASKTSATTSLHDSANIQVQREEDETNILVRILKDGSRLVYQQIDPPQEVIKLIREVANIDLDANPLRKNND